MQSEKDTVIQVLQKAHEAGYRFSSTSSYQTYHVTSFNNTTGRIAIVLKAGEKREIVYLSLPLLVFELDFARAIFGDQWEEHLNLLSHSKDHLQYLRESLFI